MISVSMFLQGHGLDFGTRRRALSRDRLGSAENDRGRLAHGRKQVRRYFLAGGRACLACHQQNWPASHHNSMLTIHTTPGTYPFFLLAITTAQYGCHAERCEVE